MVENKLDCWGPNLQSVSYTCYYTVSLTVSKSTLYLKVSMACIMVIGVSLSVPPHQRDCFAHASVYVCLLAAAYDKSLMSAFKLLKSSSCTE